MTRIVTSTLQNIKGSLRWACAHKLRIGVLGIVFAIMAPRPVKSQLLDPCCAILAAGLSTIASTLSSVIGGGLNNILSTDQAIQNFERNVVWPANQISQAQVVVGNVSGISGQIQRVTGIPVNSATLPSTQQLEQNLLSADSGQIPQTTANYTAVYSAVPSPTAASPQVRNMVDMSDAVAQDAMKRAIEIDNLANLELQAADQINQSIQTAAPGSAPIVEAQADAWLVRANAYTQAATADLMRVRAVDLANAGTSVKFGATDSTLLLQRLSNLLQRH